MNILIVRLGALGDIVHALPAAAALRAAMPDARIDWLVDAKHRPLLDLVHGLDRIVTLNGSSVSAWIDVVRRLRQVPYDAALDMQGLMKSAVLARASGARRVAGFSIWHLREKTARPFYSATDDFTDSGRSAGVASCDLQESPSAPSDRRRYRARGVSVRGCRVASGERRAGRRRGRPLRPPESWRRMAEQALAAGAIRRGGDVSPGGPRAAFGRPVGTRRRGARGLGRAGVERCREAKRRRPGSPI